MHSKQTYLYHALKCGIIAINVWRKFGNMSDIPSRPTLTVEMLMRAANNTAVQVSGVSDSLVEKFVEDIQLVYSYGMNGFELAAALEEKGWNKEKASSFADELELMEFECSKEIDQAAFEWIERYNVTPKLEIGTVVAQGEITGIHPKFPAKYLVRPRGQDDEKQNSARLVVNFEDLEAELEAHDLV
ncbi:hypothetical protein [Vibrio sp. D431a]|uniref:hypothetical protein n=1 Tax=Vibrio sp. D431a TaxID=2837388 RepID=UPI00255523C6|nr:hypothetical protein [Vibrio sp. D431a]MDK9790196.1 hypothetical protein [Vibrio sp. D431a]